MNSSEGHDDNDHMKRTLCPPCRVSRVCVSGVVRHQVRCVPRGRARAAYVER